MTGTAPPERIGRYRIVSEIGRGAMGVVYRGEDEALGRSVAIKTIIASMDPEEQKGYLARFRQEAKALGGLNHPGIITVHDFGDHEGIAYLAMELLEGRELRDVMDAGRIELPAAVGFAVQIAEGLAHAHSQGIVHRDVKPANVMVIAGNRTKIMDFGIARVRASDVKTQTGLMMGSPKYMSPEQVMGRPLDHRTDIFSLGVMLHEMLTGSAPFGGEDVHQLMFAVCSARPAPPSSANAGIPRTLDLIVARALEKEPEARYADVAAMAADLRGALAELSVSAMNAAPAPAAAEATLVQPRPEAAERAPVQGGATLAMPIAALHLSARFESSLALQRLAEPLGQDRRLMAPSIGRPAFAKRLLSDPAVVGAVAFLAGAAALAWWIAG